MRVNKQQENDIQIPFFYGYKPNFKVIEYKQAQLKACLRGHQYKVNHFSAWLKEQVQKYKELKQTEIVNVMRIPKHKSSSQLRIITHVNHNKNLYQSIPQLKPNQKRLHSYMVCLAQRVLEIHNAGLTHNLIRLQTIFQDKVKTLTLDIPYFRQVASCVKERSSYFVAQNIYCAPEVRLNEQFSKEGDIYALGVVYLQLCLHKIIPDMHQIKQQLQQITDHSYRNLVSDMLDPNPQNRPNANEILSYFKHAISYDKVAPTPFWKEQKIVIYRRNLFDLPIVDCPHITLKKYENYQDQNYKIRIWMLNKQTVRLQLSFLKNKAALAQINFFQTDQTIKQASQYLTNADALYTLINEEQVEQVRVDSSGILELLVTNKRWFILKIAYEKQIFGKLGLNDMVIQHSQRYRNFNRCSGKAKRESLTDEQKKELNQLEYFWPEVTEALIDNKLYLQAIKLCRFNIEHFGHIKYRYSGLGCDLETKGFKVEQIVAYYKQTASGKHKNPYDQLALCKLLFNDNQQQHYFLEQMNLRFPDNAAILFMLGNHEYNQYNFVKAASFYQKVARLQPRNIKAVALGYLCQFLSKRQLRSSQIVTLLDKLQQKQEMYDFSRIVLEILLLCNDQRNLNNQNISRCLAKIILKSNPHLQKSVYFIFALLMETMDQKYVALNYYEQYKNENKQYPQIYRIVAEVSAEVNSEDLSQALSEYIQWHQGVKTNKQSFLFPVSVVKPDKPIHIIDVKAKQDTPEVMKAVQRLKKLDFSSRTMSLLQKCVQIYEKDASINYNMARVYMINKYYKQALTYYQRAAELEPQSPIVYYMMGINYENLYQKEKSMQCYRRAFELSPHTKSFNKLYNDYENRGQYREALKYVEKMIDMYPSNSEFYEMRANILLALGYPGKAQLAMLFAQNLKADTQEK